jgi:hypothetical protein
MNKKNILLLATGLVFCFTSCKKKGCTDPTATNYDAEAKKDDGSCEYVVAPNYVVPSTYTFTDASGNNTVSYGGQTARMDMLSEMTTYLKTANDGGSSAAATLDGPTLISMYDNSYTGWGDTSLVDNGKQLKSKTALGDAGIQTQFETWMTDAAAASPSTNGTYLQASTGHEWTQLIEKGLMGACFASQLTANYLAGIASDDNITPVANKYYTEMEHHWDEAYGYFTDATNYGLENPADPSTPFGTDRFWGKYANNTLEAHISSATNIATAFRTGRAAISAGYTDDAIAQASIIEGEVLKMVAGMAIHYLNSTKDKVASGEPQTKVNHYLSEAYAFIFGIQFVNNSPLSTADINTILSTIDADFVGFSQSVVNINAIIDQIATATGLESVKNDL